jgi:hypothetical protein
VRRGTSAILITIVASAVSVGAFAKRLSPWDARKNQLLWDRMIYRIRYDRNLERDVQDVFITEIHLDGKTLFVTNESSEQMLHGCRGPE